MMATKTGASVNGAIFGKQEFMDGGK